MQEPFLNPVNTLYQSMRLIMCLIVFCALPLFVDLKTFAIDTTAPVTTIHLSGTQAGDTYTSNVAMTLSATDTGGSGVEYTQYKTNDSNTWLYFNSNNPIVFTADGEYSIQYRSKDIAGNFETPKEELFTIILPTPIPTTAPETPTEPPTNTTTPTPEPENNDPQPELPTNTPTPTPEDPTIKPTATPSLTIEESIDSPGNKPIGPPIPQQMMQQKQAQQSQKGQVKSAFDEGGPDSILNNKPESGSSGVIKIFVTVISLTIAGVVGWIAMRSNQTLATEDPIEEPEKRTE